MNDAGDIADGLSAALPAVIRGVTMGAASVGVMTVISWQLTLAMLAVLPFVAVGLRWQDAVSTEQDADSNARRGMSPRLCKRDSGCRD